MARPVWEIGMTTAPRAVDYIEETLEGIRQAGWHETPLVSGEAGSPLPKGCLSFRNKISLGPWPNFRRVLELLLAVPWRVDRYLLMQDDVLLSKNLRSRLDAEVLSDDCIYSLYCAGPNDSGGENEWHEIEGVPKKAYGALAYMMTARVAERLLAWKPPNASRTKTDFWVGRFCRDEGLKYLCHSPSYAKHIGDRSALESEHRPIPINEFRQCSRFVADAAKPEESA